MPTIAAVDTVLLNPDQLLRLGVCRPQLHEGALLSRGNSGSRRRGRRGRQHEEVPDDHARDGDLVVVVGVAAGRRNVPRADDVDVVTGLERSGHQLVRIALELVRALRALDLGADALLLRRSEPARADLLAL